MLLHDDDIELDPELDQQEGDPAPGLVGLLLKAVLPKPYPLTIYNIDGQKESGIAGTLHPDGTFVPLPSTGVEATFKRTGQLPVTRYWDDVTARFVEGSIVWDSAVVGSVDIAIDPDEPHRRLWDGSMTGPWPNHPPRQERLAHLQQLIDAAEEAKKGELWN